MGGAAHFERPRGPHRGAGLARPYALRSSGTRIGAPPSSPGVGSIRVATVNAVPLYLEGLRKAFAGSELALDDPGDLCAWALVTPNCVVLVVVPGPEDVGAVIDVSRLVPLTPIVAIVQDEPIAPQLYWDLFEAHCTNVVPLRARPEILLEALRAAVRGMVIMSAEVVRRVLARASVRPIPEWLTDPEVALLARLARGTTIETLAREFGYSERAMYRRLRHLYQRLGVSGRVDAIGLAAQWGLTGSRPHGGGDPRPTARIP